MTPRAPRTFCRKDEKNGDDDANDSSAANQIPVSEFPRELEGGFRNLLLIFDLAAMF